MRCALLLLVACSSAHVTTDVGMRDAAPLDTAADSCLSEECCDDDDCVDRGRAGRCTTTGCVGSDDCLDSWADCDGDLLNGCETRLDGESNCGGCGVECADDGYCVRGECLRDAQLAVAGTATCVLDRRGDIYCAGSDVGIGDGFIDHTAMGWWQTSFGEPARAISSALSGVSFDGVVREWSARVDAHHEVRGLLAPQIVVGLPTVDALGDASTSGLANCVIDSESRVWCWGSNQGGVVNWETAGPIGLPPTHVQGLPPVQQIASSSSHACALAGGEVYCWGQGGRGATGPGLPPEPHGPRRIVGPRAGAIAVGSLKSCLIDLDGGLWCFGNRLSYASELPTTDFPPTRVPDLPPIVSVDASGQLTCAADASGGVWCFGFDAHVLLGEEERRVVRLPELVTSLEPPVQVAVAGTIAAKRACAISHGAREVWCWGQEFDGSFGVNHSDEPRNNPPTLVYTFD